VWLTARPSHSRRAMDGPARWALGAELLGSGAFTVNAAHDDDSSSNNALWVTVDLADSVPSPGPRSFPLTRAAERVLAWRALLPVLLVLALGALGIGVICPTVDHSHDPPACNPSATSPFLVGRQLGYGLQGIFLVGLLPDVRPAVAAGGHLACLGAGEGQISARHSCSLRRFAWILGVVAVVTFSWGLGEGIGLPLHDVFGYHVWIKAPYHVCMHFGTTMCKWPLSCAWGLTLHHACALASLRVRTVHGAIERVDVANERRWQHDVVEPLSELAMQTIPTVSEGWGSGAAFLCLSLWSTAFGQLSDGLYSYSSNQNHLYLACQMALFVVIILLPGVALWGIAALSTDCDALYDSLNRKRLLDPSEAVHARLKILEEMLGRLNKDQGLGVTVFGKVLDRRALATFAKQMVALLITAVTSLFALTSTQINAGTDTSCGLTEQQRLAAQSMFSTFNATCTWNLTVSPTGVTIN
jgi:hypothetical protein